MTTGKFYAIVVFLALVGTSVGGFFIGQRQERCSAVDVGSGEYSLVDQYGKVEFRWVSSTKSVTTEK